MKKLFALLLTLAMALSLAACGDKPAEDAENAEDAETPDAQTEEKAPGWWKDELKTVTDGKLTVATSPDFAPYEFYAVDENGDPKLAGFDMALAQYIADYIGLELNVVPMDFDGTIMELKMNKADLGMAGYSPAPKRASAMDFSDIYISGGQSIVSLKKNADKFPDIETANNPEYQIGAQVGSIQADLAHENTPDAKVIEMAKVTDLIAELLTGKMDAAYIETMVAEAYVKQYPELQIVVDVPYDAVGSVVGVQKGNEALLAAVNEAIAAAKDDGSFDKFVTDAIELSSNSEVLDNAEDIQNVIKEDAPAAEEPAPAEEPAA